MIQRTGRGEIDSGSDSREGRNNQKPEARRQRQSEFQVDIFGMVGRIGAAGSSPPGRNAAWISLSDWNLLSGSFSRQRRTICSSSTGSNGSIERGAGGVSRICFNATEIGVSPLNA